MTPTTAPDTDDSLSQPADTAAMSETLDAATGPACSQCGHPFATSMVTVCPKCGYYSLLGTFVEVDAALEEQTSLDAQQAVASQTHIDVWRELLTTLFQRVPRWGWLLGASLLFIVIESVTARFVTAEGSQLRTMWSLGQLAAGALVVMGVQIWVFTMAVVSSDKFGMFDLVLRPLALWAPVLEKLPATANRVLLGSSGLMAVLMSLIVIGGIPYERLLDWGFEPPPEESLLAAVVEQAKHVKGTNDSLEESVQDFAGEAGNVGQGGAAEKPPKPRLHTECVVVGYRPSKANPQQFKTLLVAAEVQGRLKVVGTVSTGFNEETRSRLNARLHDLHTHTPFVSTTKTAIWVEPRLVCRVSYVEQTSDGGLLEVKFERLLKELTWDF